MATRGGARRLASPLATIVRLAGAKNFRKSAPRAIAFACLFVTVLGACERSASPERAAASEEVVLYCSADDVIAQPIIDRFQRESGVRLKLLGDTEATKTTGLVQRLRAERGAPKADVFWSSEVFLTIALAREGVFAPFELAERERWPAELRDADGLWHGFGLRARVLVYNAKRVNPAEAPRTMHEMIESERFAGRIVMARPAFGTTRGHMAALVALWGEDAARDWLVRLRERGVRLLDGNSAVVRAVAMGEADLGLTDTDDVWSGQRQGWPVDLVYIRHDAPARAGSPAISAGPLLIPNTVSLVKGGPNPEAARRLAAFLLSEETERQLARSESRNIPVRASLAAEFSALAVPDPAAADFGAIADAMERAMALCREVLGP